MITAALSALILKSILLSWFGIALPLLAMTLGARQRDRVTNIRLIA
jgi:hypothetical protein